MHGYLVEVAGAVGVEVEVDIYKDLKVEWLVEMRYYAKSERQFV